MQFSPNIKVIQELSFLIDFILKKYVPNLHNKKSVSRLQLYFSQNVIFHLKKQSCSAIFQWIELIFGTEVYFIILHKMLEAEFLFNVVYSQKMIFLTIRFLQFWEKKPLFFFFTHKMKVKKKSAPNIF